MWVWVWLVLFAVLVVRLGCLCYEFRERNLGRTGRKGRKEGRKEGTEKQ